MSYSKFKHAKIVSIASIIPNDFINIDDEIEYFENSEKKLNRAKKIIGYGKRHFVDKNTTTVDLAYQAGHNLISESCIEKDSIDTLLFLSQTRDYILPASANILHGKLGLSENCAAMDISQGCSGYVYALWLAHSLIESGASKRVLLLSGDTISKYSDKRNRKVNQIFGDSASATLIDYCEEENPAYFTLGSKGEGWDKIVVPAGGSRLPVDEDILGTQIIDNNNNPYKLSHIMMNGLDVFNFTIDVVPQLIKDIMTFAQKSIDDIAIFLLHQANKQIVENVAIKANIPLEKTPTNTFSEYGNNACNSLAVHICANKNLETQGGGLLAGFGVGLSWAAAIINLSNIQNLGIDHYKTNNVKCDTINKEYWIEKFKGE